MNKVRRMAHGSTFAAKMRQTQRKLALSPFHTVKGLSADG